MVWDAKKNWVVLKSHEFKTGSQAKCRNAKCVLVLHTCMYVIYFSHENQTLTLGWNLSIRDYKCPLRKSLDYFHYVVCSTMYRCYIISFVLYICMYGFCILFGIGIEWYWSSLIGPNGVKHTSADLGTHGTKSIQCCYCNSDNLNVLLDV